MVWSVCCVQSNGFWQVTIPPTCKSQRCWLRARTWPWERRHQDTGHICQILLPGVPNDVGRHPQWNMWNLPQVSPSPPCRKDWRHEIYRKIVKCIEVPIVSEVWSSVASCSQGYWCPADQHLSCAAVALSAGFCSCFVLRQTVQNLAVRREVKEGPQQQRLRDVKITPKVPRSDPKQKSIDWFCWENLLETMDFPMKYGGFPVNFPVNQSIEKKTLRIPTYELEAMRSNTSHARLLTLHNFQTVNAHSTDLRWCGTGGGNTPGLAKCFPLTRSCSKGAEDLFSNCWSPLQSLSIIAKYWQNLIRNRSDCHQIRAVHYVHLTLAKNAGLFHMYPAFF